MLYNHRMMEPESFRYAGFWRRFNAYGIDATIVLVITWLLDTLLLGQVFAQTPDDFKALTDAVATLQSGTITPEMQATAKESLLRSMLGGSIIPGPNHYLMMVVSAVYNILFVAGKWHATPGKHWLRITVLMKDGRPLTLLESAIRHTVTGVSMAPLGLGYATMFFSRQKLALHDMICNTRVVYR